MPCMLVLLICLFTVAEATIEFADKKVRKESYLAFSANSNTGSGIEPTVTLVLGSTGSPIKCAAICKNSNCLQFAWNKHTFTCYLYDNDGVVKNITDLAFYGDNMKQYLINGYEFDETKNYLYKIHLYPMNYQDAMNVCSNESGHLLIIDSQSKQNYFASILTGLSVFVLINGSDDDQDGEWTYSNGTVMKQTFWDGSQGNQGRRSGEDCIGLYSVANFKWHDIYCHIGASGSPTAFICEIDI